MNRVSQAAAIAALESRGYYRERIETVRKDRAWLTDELRRRGFEVGESQANFVFARREDAKAIYEGLLKRKVLVRYFPKGRLAGGIRVSIGTRAQLERLLAGIDEIG